MKVELTELADADVAEILSQTATIFGPRQLDAYATIIKRGVAMIGESPERPGSVERPGLSRGVRMLHLELAAGRRGAAAHCLYYIRGRLSNGDDGVVVLRVLHERMEPRLRLSPEVGIPPTKSV